MALLRVIVRPLGFVLLVVVAALGLGALVLAVTGGSVASDLGLPAVREAVGSFLADAEAGRAAAVAAAAGAIVVGLLLLVGLLAPARERLVVVDEGTAGRLAARRRALEQVAQALVARARGVSGVKARIRAPRRGRGGRLTVVASHPLTTAASDAERAAESAVNQLAEGFGLRVHVHARPGEGRGRVQ